MAQSSIEAHEPEPFRRAAAQVVAAFVVLAALFGLYTYKVRRSHEAKLLSVKAAAMLDLGDVVSLRQAEASYLEALGLQASNEHAIAGLAWVYAMLWVDHGITAVKDKAIDFVEQARKRGIERPERYGAEVLVLYAQGRYRDGRRLAASVITRGGASEKLQWAEGLVARADGQFVSGRESLARAEELRRRAPHYATALGEAYEDDNDSRNAEVFWLQAAQTNPAYVRGAAFGLVARARRGEAVGALEAELKRLDAMDPQSLGTRDRAAIERARSVLSSREGNGRDALAAIDRAIALEGDKVALVATRGQVLLAAGNRKDGLASLAQAHAKSGGAPRYLYLLSDAYQDSGEIDDAIGVLKGAEAAHASEPGYHVALGNAFRAKGDFVAAGAAYDQALALQADHPEALLAHGILAGLIGIEKRALAEADTELEEAERELVAQGADLRRREQFYAGVVKAYAAARGGASYVKKWAAKQAALKK